MELLLLRPGVDVDDDVAEGAGIVEGVDDDDDDIGGTPDVDDDDVVGAPYCSNDNVVNNKSQL